MEVEFDEQRIHATFYIVPDDILPYEMLLGNGSCTIIDNGVVQAQKEDKLIFKVNLKDTERAKEFNLLGEYENQLQRNGRVIPHMRGLQSAEWSDD